MQVHTELTFHGLDHNASAEAAVERWVARLEHMHHRLSKCEVVIGQPRSRQRDFHVHVLIEGQGVELASNAEHDDLYLAIADAFRAAHRQLRTSTELRLAS